MRKRGKSTRGGLYKNFKEKSWLVDTTMFSSCGLFLTNPTPSVTSLLSPKTKPQNMVFFSPVVHMLKAVLARHSDHILLLFLLILSYSSVVAFFVLFFSMNYRRRFRCYSFHNPRDYVMVGLFFGEEKIGFLEFYINFLR